MNRSRRSRRSSTPVQPVVALALCATAALTFAVHPVTSFAPAADDASAVVIGPRCTLVWDPPTADDGLWQLPASSLVVPFELVEAGYPDWPHREHDVIIEAVCTAYSSTYDQCDSTPFITASMERVRPGIIALSRDLLQRYTPGAPFRYGDYVEVVGVGVFQVEDTMNRRWRRRADIWVENIDDARVWGKKQVLLARVAAPAGDAPTPLFDISAPASTPQLTAARVGAGAEVSAVLVGTDG